MVDAAGVVHFLAHFCACDSATWRNSFKVNYFHGILKFVTVTDTELLSRETFAPSFGRNTVRRSDRKIKPIFFLLCSLWVNSEQPPASQQPSTNNFIAQHDTAILTPSIVVHLSISFHFQYHFEIYFFTFFFLLSSLALLSGVTSAKRQHWFA